MQRLELPPGEIKGTGILIYPKMPAGCPFQQSENHSPCGKHLYGVAVAPGAPKGLRAFGCEDGHRVHVRERDL